MTAAVRALGFDYTGVVALVPEGNIFDQVAALAGVGSEAVRDSYHKYNRDFQLGRLSQEQLWQQVAADLNIRDRFQELWQLARARLPRIDRDMLAFVDQLRAAGYKTGLLSNLAPRTPWHDQLFHEGVPAHFDAVCLSGDTGHAKPDPAAFLDLARKLGVDPHELLYVDDRQSAMKEAAKIGVTTLEYASISRLQQQLSSLGLHWNENSISNA